MDPRKQATLLNYHKAIQDSVDIDKVWPDMEAVFTDQDKRSIQVLSFIHSFFLSFYFFILFFLNF